jgi:hypothetical protein
MVSACAVIQQIAARPTVETPSGSILFREDFSSDKNGWKTWNEDGSYVKYEGEGLHFFIGKQNYDFWSKPGYRFSDVIIEVDAVKIDGPDNNAYGVICRMVDEENYYAFIISSDGYAGILKVKGGIYQLLNNETLDYSTSIIQSDAMNKITAGCIGNQLTMRVNDTEIFLLTDPDFSVGDVGLMAGSYNEPGTDIFFDNLTVFQP